MFSTELLDHSPMRIHRLSSTSQAVEHIPQKNNLIDDLIVYEPNDYEIGVEMLTSGRFAHSHQYILALIEKYSFHIISIQDIIVRTEVSVPLPGKIYILIK